MAPKIAHYTPWHNLLILLHLAPVSNEALTTKSQPCNRNT